MVLFTTFVNGRICRNGELVEDQFVVSEETGEFLKRTGYIGGEAIDLEDAIVAPGYLELQTNGMLGFHFTQFEDKDQYLRELQKVSRHLVTKGVTGFWATIPTVAEGQYKKILPYLRPQSFGDSASLLGAHVEGPFLHSAKKGAHNAALFHTPQNVSEEQIYGVENLRSCVKLVTLAPELPGSDEVISRLSKNFGIRVSLGHSSASYDQGLRGLLQGAAALTHVFNAMNPLHHRNPGLAGLISSPEASPYYSLIPDGIHLHPATLNMAYRANPKKCILITDSVELAGLPDGIHPGNAQVPHKQTKKGNKVVIQGTETLIGSCCSMDECVRNLIRSSGCSIAEAVQCVTENVADMMGLENRGKVEEGKRADFVVLDDDGEVLQTWISGKKVWER